MDVLPVSPCEESALESLPASLRIWFRHAFRTSTPAQRQAWPVIASGRSLLLSAPTGTGKTLAAMMPILGELLNQSTITSSVRCLYLAPLKALVNDLQTNLERHLSAIREQVTESLRWVEVATRTGDTSPSDRRRLWDEPPEILLTTPESLAVLLSHPESANLFSDLRWIVVDEIHALVGNKRGADLALSLERLEEISANEIQRIGLSATSAPLSESACFLVGADRECVIAEVRDSSPLELSLIPLHNEPGFLRRLLDHLEPHLRGNQGPASTLIFTNTRSLAERLAWQLRHRFPIWNQQVAVHHSSLAFERRREVEQRFKSGEIRVMVSSTSLELGIDIGTVDLVVLVHPPGGVVRLLQRVGRAGHAPGLVKRALLFTSTPAELFEAVVTGAAGKHGQHEPMRMAQHSLDVLCQQLLGLSMVSAWTADEAFHLVKRAGPYHALSREDFDACLAYLLGKRSLSDEETWLPPRLNQDGDRFSIIDTRTARLLRRNLGTILTEATCEVILESSDSEREHYQIGQVDESFAERLQAGDHVLLDGRCLEFRRLELSSNPGLSSQVIVREVVGRPFPPRWAGEGAPLSSSLASRLFVLRGQAAEALLDGKQQLRSLLASEYGLEGEALEDLIAWFEQQECQSEIPSATTLLIEEVPNVMGADYYLHTPLNRAGNEALARVAARRLERQGRGSIGTIVADLGLALMVRDRRGGVCADDFREVLSASGFVEELEASLTTSFLLRSRFQRVAMTGLMLLRNPAGGRPRVGGRSWGEHQLFDLIVQQCPDFVLLHQAQRELRAEVCDFECALAYVNRLPSLTVRCRQLAQPGPFVEAWTQAHSEPPLSSDDALHRLHAELMGTGE